MYVRLGNAAPKEGYREAVDRNRSADDLRAEAESLGVSTEGKKDEVADRLDNHVRHRPLDGSRVTEISFPETTVDPETDEEKPFTIAEAFTTITAANGVWRGHSDEPPAWVESDNSALASLLAENFGCTVGAPKNLEETHHTEYGPPGVGPDGPLNAAKEEANAD